MGLQLLVVVVVLVGGGGGGGLVCGFKWKLTVCRLSFPWLIVREVGLMFNLNLPFA